MLSNWSFKCCYSDSFPPRPSSIWGDTAQKVNALCLEGQSTCLPSAERRRLFQSLANARSASRIFKILLLLWCSLLMEMTPASHSPELFFLPWEKLEKLYSSADSLYWNREKQQRREKEGKSHKKGKWWVCECFILTTSPCARNSFTSYKSQQPKLSNANWFLTFWSKS